MNNNHQSGIELILSRSIYYTSSILITYIDGLQIKYIFDIFPKQNFMHKPRRPNGTTLQQCDSLPVF